MSLLSEMRASVPTETAYLFPGDAPDKPLQDIKKFWDRLTRQAGLSDYRLHDNRHTHASHLVSSGLSLEIVGRLLGHTNPLTTKRYAHLADDPLRAAAERFGARLTALREAKSAEVYDPSTKNMTIGDATPAPGSSPPRRPFELAEAELAPEWSLPMINGGVYQVSVPRAEVVKADGMEVPDAMGSAIAIIFQPTGSRKAAIAGDFVLAPKEVNPVLRALRTNGME